VKSREGNSSIELGRICHFRMLLYCSPSMIPLIRWRCPTPDAVKQPHTISFALCLTVAVEVSVRTDSPRSFHTLSLPPYRRTKGDSSDQRMRSHCSNVHPTCSRAQWSLLIRFFSLINGFLVAQPPLNNPSERIREEIVHVLTCSRKNLLDSQTRYCSIQFDFF